MEKDLEIERESEQKNNDEQIFGKQTKDYEYSNDYEDSIKIPKELRKIRTQAYDKSVEDTVNMIKNNRIFLEPDFQRGSQIWDYKTSSQLIESVLLNVPIPPIYVAEEDDGTWNIIDGLQRLTSFKNFYENKFKLRGLDSLKELNKQNYNELNSNAKNILNNGLLRIVLITKESHPEMKYDVFMRLNRGAVKLKEQELRNCLYRGTLNDLLKELRHNEQLLKILKLTEPHIRMDDAELILRYFALSKSCLCNGDNVFITEYTGIMKTFLNSYMEKHKELSKEEIDILRKKFNTTLNRVYALFGEDSFRRIDSNGKFLPYVNKAIYDFMMLSFEKFDLKVLLSKKAEILNILKECSNEDKTFVQAITVGTSEPKKLEYRLSVWFKKMNEVMSK
ncbi:MAG: DUF262 domain-containing protein [Elusimicrobia bacterium]|nr:DUF262 domain-containing protein [Elusimicrobiota bacterium]